MTILTDAEVRNIPDGKTRTESLGRGNGAMLFWRERGNVQCYYRYYSGNRPTLIHIGPFTESKADAGYSLKECREKANDLAKTKREIGKQDLKQYLELEAEKARLAQIEAQRQKEIEATRGSLADLIAGYIQQLERDGKDSVKEAKRSMEKDVIQAYPAIAKKKARDISPDDICDIIATIVDRDARVQANRVRSLLHAAFQYGAHADYDPARRGNKRFNLEHNPVGLIKKDNAAEKTHDRVLSDHELQDFYLNIHHSYKVGIIAACLVRMMVATAGQRPKMLIRSTWQDYDFERRTITLTERKGRAKPRKHVIPFTARAIRIMRIVQAHNSDLPGPFYTVGGKEMGLDSLKNVFKYWHNHRTNKAMELNLPEPEKFTARDIRRTITNLITDAGVRPEDNDQLQSHDQTGVVKKHYDRHHHLPRKRAAIRQYDRRLSSVLTGRKWKAEQMLVR
ncbi:tyrosine-type recombinase/integrase [Endozoicomonas sp. ALE010]|uniref:tyrosine-type recombinase/integrase n=1 Tax=Endozoicomonas sp. ALE010 TaxID=3403081 RepID=UPI003BB76D4C